jgi:hypothetical protein
MGTHMSRIRRKLSLSAENGVRLKSVYTHGYRLTMGNVELDDPMQSDRQTHVV